MSTFDVDRAQYAVERAALRSIAVAVEPYHPNEVHADAAARHATEELALAARDLVRAVEALPEDKRPIGWDTETVAT